MENNAEAANKSVCVACGEEFTGNLTHCPKDGTPLTQLKTGGLIGTVLGDRYEILSLIGDGAMGQVYKARHKLLKRIVAVKMLHPNLVSGAAALKRFQKEAELASALNHPNILTVHDFGVTDDGSPYLVMAYLEGKSLAELTAGGQHLDLKRSLHIFKQVCQGLGHAHDNEVVHRDLKPSNVMLVKMDDDPDFVKIVDFGIAKLLAPGESSDNLTRTGEVFGSPPYMSPEQCRAKPVDARSDIYSMGCLMYRTVSGKQPISGNDLIEYLYKHVNERPASFSEAAPELNIPPQLEEIIFKAMAKAPEERYQSMSELKTALEPIYATLPGAALTSTDIPRLVDKEQTVAFGVKESTAGADKEAEAQQTTPEPVLPEQPAVGTAEDTKVGRESEPDSGTQHKNIPLAQTAAAGPVQAGLKQKLQIGAVAVILVLVIASALLFKPGLSAEDKAITKLQDEARQDYNQGNYAPAKLKIRQAIKMADQSRSKLNAGNHHLLGLLQYAQGSYDDAQANLETAISEYKKYYSDKGDEIADCQAYFGRAATALGQYDEAEEALQKSLKARTSSHGKDDLSVADSLTGLGYLHMRIKKIEPAQAELSEALTITRKAKGEDSQETASALNNLGQAQQLAGKFKQAEENYRHGLAIRLQKLDSKSPFIADSYTCLGAVCASTGRLKEARDFYQKALAIQEKTLSPADPRLTQTQKQYADVVLKMRR